MNNILFVLHSRPIITDGGVQRSANTIGNYLKDNGFTVVMLITTSNNIAQETIDHIPIFYVPDDKLDSEICNQCIKSIINKYNINYVLSFNGFCIKTVKYVDRNISDNIVHYISQRNGFLSYINNIDIIYLEKENNKWHNVILFNKITLFILKTIHIVKHRYLYNIISKKVDKIIVQSPKYIDELKYFVKNISTEKVVSIYNPIKPQIDYSLSKENIILFVGRIDYNQKRPDRLLYVWKTIQDKYPDWKLVFVGDGPYLDVMKTICRTQKIKNATFTGFSKPEYYYQVAKIFCMTSTFEGFGNVKLEAQSFGCVPILFDSYAAASDLVNNSLDSFLIKPFDLKEYAEKIELLINDIELLKRMSKNAYRNASRFEPTNIMNQWINLFINDK